MRFLLDTHTLIRALQFTGKLSRRASLLIADTTNEILISAASAWGIATKFRLGKLPKAVRLSVNLMSILGQAGFVVLVIETESPCVRAVFAASTAVPLTD